MKSAPTITSSGLSKKPMILVLIVALLHFYFMVLESFLWTRPIGLKTFGNSLEKAQLTKVLALNQGLYNGFLGAGLLWSLITDNVEMQLFLLVCVIIAGIVGGLTASKKIIIVQALPAVAALILRCVQLYY